MTPDPLLTSARNILRTARDDIRTATDGLPLEALNWRPAGDETNSIAVLANHVLSSTITWLTVAVDEPLPERDRPSEFEFAADSPEAFAAMVDERFERCLALTSKDRSIDWSAIRKHWDATSGVEVLAAWALVHALEHLGEHVGHITLTRQLWDAR
jgi:hypothetical protein